MKPDINPILVETNGVLELLQSLNIHKACGPDEIPAHLLKEACKEFAPSLSFIFQASLQQCTVPLDWKRANIVPLFKKGDRSTPSNYRPVSLTCICSKLLEHIVYSHIQHTLLNTMFYVINNMDSAKEDHVNLSYC